MNQLIISGLEISLFGLGGVFAVLILFYLSTKIMLFILKKKSKEQIIK